MKNNLTLIKFPLGIFKTMFVICLAIAVTATTSSFLSSITSYNSVSVVVPSEVEINIDNILLTIDGLEAASITEVEFDQVNLAATTATAQTAESLYLASMKHTDSPYVAKALFTLATQGVLNAKGDCRSSGSLCMWGGANFQTMTGSIAITFVAGKRVTYTVITGPLIQPTAAAILSNKALVKLAEGHYLDTSVATWTISLILSVGGTTGKSYNPSEPISFGEGWASWEYKQAQYGLYVPITGIVLPTPPTLH